MQIKSEFRYLFGSCKLACELLFELTSKLENVIYLCLLAFEKLIQTFHQGEDVPEEAYASTANKDLPDFPRPRKSKRSKRKRAV